MLIRLIESANDCWIMIRKIKKVDDLNFIVFLSNPKNINLFCFNIKTLFVFVSNNKKKYWKVKTFNNINNEIPTVLLKKNKFLTLKLNQLND